jgi:Ca2+-binding RTX toxin-like protein
MASDTASGGSVYNTAKGGYYGGPFLSYPLDSNVRALLMDNRWVTAFGGSTIPTSMKYSFPTQKTDYTVVAGYPDADAVAVYKVATPLQQQATIASFGLVDSYVTVEFVKDSSGLASDVTFRIAGITGNEPSHAWFPAHSGPYYASDSRAAGDVWLNDSNATITSANFYGTDEFLTVMHELGHALGLKHGHDAGYNGALPTALNDSEFSVMTYASYPGADPSVTTPARPGSSAQSYMMYDIAALQALYGANLSQVGKKAVYTWDSGTGQQYISDGTTNAVAPFTGATEDRSIFSTVWTRGATATYDLSNFADNQVDDMRPGRWMLFSREQRADLDIGAPAGTPQYQAQGNVYNALLYYGDTRSEITELITGSGNDIVTGNDLDNIISTNGGDDTLIGGPGTDRLYGGAGNDTLSGGTRSAANNQLWGGDGNDTASYEGVAGVVYADLAKGVGLIDGSEADVYNSIENLTAGSGPATLIGDGNANVLTGGAANDLLYGQEGDDTLIGGGVSAGGVNQLWGGGGSDTASYAGTTGRVTADLRAQAGYVNGVIVDQMNSLENLVGGSAGDTLIGTSGANRLTGGGGADALYGMGGADIFAYLAYGDSNLLAGYDTIEDFVSGTSRLDLKAFATDASHVSIVSDAQTTSLYLMMVAGAFNAATDLAISLVGANAINNTDIIF